MFLDSASLVPQLNRSTKIFCLCANLITRGKKKAWQKLQEVNLHHNINKKYMNKGLLKHGFLLTASWQLKNIFSVHLGFPCSWPVTCISQPLTSTVRAQQGNRQSVCSWDPTLFHHVWLGLFSMLSYKMYFHSYCTMWIYRLGFIYGSHRTVLHHIFFFNSCPHTCVSRTDKMQQQHDLLVPLI
jgi:hypothetical protein